MIKKLSFLVVVLSLAAYAQMVAPKASVNPLEYDFGTVEEGTLVKINYKVTNTGGDLLKITDVKPACGCTAAPIDKKELKPNETATIKAEFNTLARVGRQDKQIVILTNDPNNSQITVKFHGNVVKKVVDLNTSPKLKFDETKHYFGKVKEGDKVDYTFKYKNIGKVTLNIKSADVTCDCIETKLSKTTLKAGETGTLKVTLDTTERLGKISRNIMVQSDDPEEPRMIVTIFADIEK